MVETNLCPGPIMYQQVDPQSPKKMKKKKMNKKKKTTKTTMFQSIANGRDQQANIIAMRICSSSALHSWTTKAVERPKTSSDAMENEDSFTSWASFILAHLHGQDNITTFTSEDNEL
nr:hypothetical protein [Tanacetum cinerariifolium]